MQNGRWTWAVGLLLMVSGGALAGQAVTVPTAGLKLTLPDGYDLGVPAQPLDALLARQMAGEEVIGQALIRVEPIRRGYRADRFLADDYMAMRKSPGWESLKVLARAKLKVAGKEAHGRLLRSGPADDAQYTAQAAFIRELADQEFDLIYLVTVNARASQKETLIDHLESICKSLELTDLASIRQGELALVAEPVAVPVGMTLQVPQGWYAMPQGPRIVFGQTEFATGQPGLIRGGLQVEALQPGTTLDSQVSMMLEQNASQRQMAEQAGQDPANLPELTDAGQVNLGQLTARKLVSTHKAAGLVRMLVMAVETWPEAPQPLRYMLQIEGPLDQKEYIESAAATIAKAAQITAPQPEQPEQPARSEETGPDAPDQPDNPLAPDAPQPDNPLVPEDGPALPGVGDQR